MLDEADEMLSRGFKDQIYDVFKNLPAEVQVRETQLPRSSFEKCLNVFFVKCYFLGDSVVGYDAEWRDGSDESLHA